MLDALPCGVMVAQVVLAHLDKVRVFARQHLFNLY